MAQYKLEILKLSRIELLPAYQTNIISEQVSSYDTTGGNNDGFTGKYSFLREENTNTITLILKNSPVGAENGKLFLNRIFLEIESRYRIT